jgi:predicted porin
MPLGKLPTFCLILVAAANLHPNATAMAQHQPKRGPPWKHAFELSEHAGRPSKKPAADDEFVIIRGANDIPAPGADDDVDYLISLGYRGIWTSEAGPWNSETPGADDTDGVIHYTMRYDGLRLGLAVDPGAPSARNGAVFAADFDRRFVTFGLGLTASYAPADPSADLDLPDFGAWTVGARFSVGGLDVSGEIRKAANTAGDAGPATGAGWDEEWNLGARYRWGHNDISLAYAYGENRPEPAAAGDDKLDAAALSYARKLIGGVEWSINLLWTDRDAAAASGPAGLDGTSLSTAVRLSF